MSKVIDEIRSMTANEVAKKQDAAKLNYPKIIEKIKIQAALGCSYCTLSLYELNEYDKKLLEQEGFSVWLTENTSRDYNALADYKAKPLKIWEIKW